MLALLGMATSGHAAPGEEARSEQRKASHVDRLVTVGKDGVITRSERVFLRQIGLDKIAIAQTVKETKDGGRLTRTEAQRIIKAYGARHQKTDAELLDEICKRSPLYPPCKDR